MIITGKIKYFKLNQVLFVKVPNLPEFKVLEYAKNYLTDQKICDYIPEMMEYNQNQKKENEMAIEKDEKELIIKDRSFFFNIVNTIYPLQVSK